MISGMAGMVSVVIVGIWNGKDDVDGVGPGETGSGDWGDVMVPLMPFRCSIVCAFCSSSAEKKTN